MRISRAFFLDRRRRHELATFGRRLCTGDQGSSFLALWALPAPGGSFERGQSGSGVRGEGLPPNRNPISHPSFWGTVRSSPFSEAVNLKWTAAYGIYQWVGGERPRTHRTTELRDGRRPDSGMGRDPRRGGRRYAPPIWVTRSRRRPQPAPHIGVVPEKSRKACRQLLAAMCATANRLAQATGAVVAGSGRRGRMRIGPVESDFADRSRIFARAAR